MSDCGAAFEERIREVFGWGMPTQADIEALVTAEAAAIRQFNEARRWPSLGQDWDSHARAVYDAGRRVADAWLSLRLAAIHREDPEMAGCLLAAVRLADILARPRRSSNLTAGYVAGFRETLYRIAMMMERELAADRPAPELHGGPESAIRSPRYDLEA